LPMRLEGSLVLVHLVEEKEVRIDRGPVRPVHEAPGLGCQHRASLLGEEGGERVTLALRRTDRRHDGQNAWHHSSPRDPWAAAPAAAGSQNRMSREMLLLRLQHPLA